MSEIVEFLLARIAEDEADRVTRLRKGYLPTPRELREAGRWEAECEAKRRIVEAWGHVLDTADSDPFTRQVRETAGHAFRCLALPYADHPDFRPEWESV